MSDAPATAAAPSEPTGVSAESPTATPASSEPAPEAPKSYDKAAMLERMRTNRAEKSTQVEEAPAKSIEILDALSDPDVRGVIRTDLGAEGLTVIVVLLEDRLPVAGLEHREPPESVPYAHIAFGLEGAASPSQEDRLE